MKALTSERIVAAILGRFGLDGSGAVLGDVDDIVRIGRPAPVVMAANHIEDRWPEGGPYRSRAREDVSRFELLSLAARLAMSGDQRAYEIAAALSAREGVPVRLNGFPVVEASVIEEAIALACAAIAGTEAGSGLADPRKHPARTGLILRGVRIRGPLNIYNGEIPFPIRLIGCVIEDAIIADHCRVRSLDLSGSAIGGFSATFLDAGGNVRLRRTVCLGPVDLGGAHIRGVLDFGDAVVFPHRMPPTGSAFTGDRGVLNLSLARIENECRFNRARIYGGLTMKGALVERSMFVEDAMIYSPIATVARMALRWLINRGKHPGAEGPFDASGYKGLPEEIELEKEMPHAANLIFGRNSEDPRRRAEVHGFPDSAYDPDKQSLLHRLLGESVRARTTAFRGDGLKIRGSLFARRLLSAGRFRLRYAELDGSLNLGGSILLSSRKFFDSLAILERVDEPRVRKFCRLAKGTREKAQRRERGEGDSFALDVRDIRIGGVLNLGAIKIDMAAEDADGRKSRILPQRRAFSRPTGKDGRKVQVLERTLVHGSIVARQADVGTGLDLSYVIFETSKVLPFPKDDVSTDSAVPLTDDDGGSFRPGTSIDLTHIKIGCDLTFLHAKDIRGIEMSYAEVTGSVFMHGPRQQVKSERDRENDRDLDIPGVEGVDRAKNRCTVTGQVLMRSVKIGGDADLLFGKPGPDAPDKEAMILNLRYSDIGGGLSIYPTRASLPGDSNDDCDFDGVVVDPTEPEYREILQAAGLRNGRITAAQRRKRKRGAFFFGRRMTDGSMDPFKIPASRIDLRNVRAKVLRHPPTAWPDRNGLRLTQLKYETTGTSGPLGVHVDRSREATAHSPTKVIFWAWAFAVVGLAGFSASCIIEVAFPKTLDELDTLGRINLGLLWLAVWSSLGMRTLRRGIGPDSRSLKPMGAFWLALQRRRRNPFRTGAWYLPTEPFLVAANALRADGKLRSAELIELERARARRKTLSRRHHTLASLGLQMLDYVAQYGYDISRTIVGGVFLIIALACVFETAEHSGYIQPAGEAAKTPPFTALPFAADLVVPLIGTGDSKVWVVAPKREAVSNPADAAQAAAAPPALKDLTRAQEFWWRVLVAITWLASIAGIFGTAVIAASLAARTESFFSRLQQ